VCLFLLAVVAATAALMLAGEADGSGGGRTPEERIVALVVLTLAACAVSCWVIFRLYALYVSAPLRMAEELAATLAHGSLRVSAHGAGELQVLGRRPINCSPCAKRAKTMSPSACAKPAPRSRRSAAVWRR
jgi:hypothetical protein